MSSSRWTVLLFATALALAAAYGYFWLLDKLAPSPSASRLSADYGLLQQYPVSGGIPPGGTQHPRALRAPTSIIFVHGLGADPSRTWHDGDICWITDLLPDDLERKGLGTSVQLLTFNYDSFWVRNSTSTRLTITSESLRRELADHEACQHGLILVGHSYGGLVIKQALVDMPELSSRVKGIIFLGTPHRGTPFTRYGIWAASLLAPLDADAQIMHSLIEDNVDLDDLEKRFSRYFRNTKRVYYFEKIKMRRYLLGVIPWIHEFIVPEQSATAGADDFQRRALHSDHRGMNKFRVRNSNYMQVSRELISLAEERLIMSQGLHRTFSRHSTFPQSPTSPTSGFQFNSTFPKLDSAGRNNQFLLRSQDKMLAEERARVAIENGVIGANFTTGREPIRVLPYPQNSKFVGRQDLIEQLVSRLQIEENTHKRLALFGLGGVGKSQLALEFAYRFCKDNPTASVFWVHAGNQNRIEQEFHAIANELGIEGNLYPSTSTLSLVKLWLSKRRADPWLMIVDNADDRDTFFGPLITQSTAQSASQNRCLWDYLPESPNSAMLFTTRNKPLGMDLMGGGDLIPVPLMSYADAKALFTSKLQTAEAPEASMKKLFSLLEYLPLAIVQAAAAIDRKSQTVAEYLELYEGTESAPIALLQEDFRDRGRDGESANAVFRTWSISFDQINRDSRTATELLSLMSFFDWQSIPKSLLRHHLGAPIQLEEALGILKGYSLIRPTWDGTTFDIHRLVQLCVKGWLQQHDKYDQWANTALRIVKTAYPPGEEHENWSSCALLLPHAQKLLQASSSISNLSKATLQFNVAGYLDSQGRYASAESMFRDSLRIRQALLGEEHADTFAASHGLGFALYHLGKYDEAHTILRSTWEARRNLLGDEHEHTLASEDRLSDVLWSLEKYDEAESLSRAVLVGRQKVLGLKHKDTMESTRNCVTFLWHHGKFLEAERMIRGLLEDMRKLDPKNPAVISTGTSHAAMLQVMGKHGEAEQLFRDLLQRITEKYGKEHPETLDCLDRLSWTIMDQGRAAEAQDIQRQVLEGYEKTLGRNHPDTVLNLFNYGDMLFRDAKYNQSQAVMEDSFERLKETYGEDHPRTIYSLVWVLFAQRHRQTSEDTGEMLDIVLDKIRGWTTPSPDMLKSIGLVADILQIDDRLEEAEQMHRRAVMDGTGALGASHPTVLTLQNNLTLLLVRRYKFVEAEDLARQTLRQRLEVLGDHPDTLASKTTLANALQMQSKFTEAADIYREAYDQSEELLGANHQATFSNRALLASVLQDLCRFHEAKALFRQNLTMRTDKLGPDHHDTLVSNIDLASVLKDMGEYQSSEQLYRDVLARRVATLGERDRLSLNSRANLVSVLHDQFKYVESERLCRETLRMRAETFGSRHFDTIASKTQLANSLDSQCKFDEAEKEYREVMDLRRELQGEDHPQALTSKYSVAIISIRRSKVVVANELLREVVDRRKVALGPEHQDTLATQHELASLLNDQYHFEEAEALHRTTLEHRRRLFGETHKDTLASKKGLITCLRTQRKLDEANQLGRELLAETLSSRGDRHFLTLEARSSLAGCLILQRRFEEAEQLDRQTLETSRDMFGEDHANTIGYKCNVASSLQAQKRFEEAEQLYVEALGQSRSVYGEDHPDTISNKAHLAKALLLHDKVAEATVLYEQIVEQRSRVLGQDHPDTIASRAFIAYLAEQRGELTEAEQMFRDLLAQREALLGVEHPHTLASRQSLAACIYKQERYSEVEPLDRGTLSMRERVLGPEHPDTVTSKHDLATCLLELEGFEEAEQLFRQALEVRTRDLGESDPDTLTAQYNVAKALNKQGRYAAAEPIFRAVLASREVVLGGDDVDTILAKDYLSTTLSWLGDHAAAAALGEEVCATRERVQGPDHADTLRSLENQGAFLDSMDRYAESEGVYRAVLERRRRAHGEMHPDSLKGLGFLAMAVGLQGRLGEAEGMFREVFVGMLEVRGRDHEDTVKARGELDTVLRILGRAEEEEEEVDGDIVVVDGV